MCSKILFVVFGSLSMMSVALAFSQTSDLELINQMVRKRLDDNKKSRPSVLSLISSEAVGQDIELVEDQSSELAGIEEAYQLWRAQIIKDHTTEDGGFVFDSNAMEQVRAMTEDTKSRKMNVLLPHQLVRLEEIATQVHIQKAGCEAAIVHSNCLKKLGIDSEQKQRIEKRAKEISKQLQIDIKKMKDRAREELLQELTPTQRKEFDRLKGEPIEFGEKLQNVR